MYSLEGQPSFRSAFDECCIKRWLYIDSLGATTTKYFSKDTLPRLSDCESIGEKMHR